MRCLECDRLGHCPAASKAGAAEVFSGYGCDRCTPARAVVLEARAEAVRQFGPFAVEGLLKTQLPKRSIETMANTVDLDAIREMSRDDAYEHLLNEKGDDGKKLYKLFDLRDAAVELKMKTRESMKLKRKPMVEWLLGQTHEGGEPAPDEPAEKTPKRRGGRRKKDADPEPDKPPKKKRGGRRRKKGADPEPPAEETKPEPEEKTKKRGGRRRSTKSAGEPAAPTPNGLDLSKLEEKLGKLIDLINNSGAAVDQQGEDIKALKADVADLAEALVGVAKDVVVISHLFQTFMTETDFTEEEVEKMVTEALASFEDADSGN